MRCKKGGIPFIRPQPAGEKAGQEEAAESEKWRDKTGPPFVYAEYFPSCKYHPEEERRLMTVRHSIEMRNEKIAALPHFPYNGYTAGFINGKEGTRYRHAGPENQPETG